MKVLYIVLGDLNRKDSGSGVRPNCMLRAFQERGHELYVLSGSQNIGDGTIRREAVKKAKEWVEANRPDFCYIESSTYPIMHSCDYGMIRYLHRKKIPTSYFYRDIYRILPNLVNKRAGLKNRVKDYFLGLLQKYTDHMLRRVDVVYFPSDRFTRYFNYKRMELLPPAGEVMPVQEHPVTNTCIYVGGVSDFYGFPLMMEAFRILNADGIKYRLILVCREKEYRAAYGGQTVPEWLEVHHVSGKDLEPLYARADLGLLALRYNEYSHLCIGIKLFQYVGYGLPVLSTNVYTMAKIIRENDFGEVAEENAEDYAAAIQRMLGDREKLGEYRRAMRKNMEEKHLWVHRVDKIVADMTGAEPKC